MHIEFPWILFLSRVVLAVVMIYYGWPKIRDPRSNAEDFVRMGFHPGMFWGTLIAVVEFVGGIAILSGFYPELAAALFGFQMMVGTFWKLKIKKKFTDYSYDLQLLALCLVIVSQGAGMLGLTAFPWALFFLRWDVAAIALVAALLLALLSRPESEKSRERAAAVA